MQPAKLIAKTPAWSFSALNNFESCPKKFWHLRVRKDYKEVEGDAILFGKRVHKALELLVKDGKPLPENLTYLQPYVQPFIDIPAIKLTEQQLAINADYEPCSWFDKSTWCRVVIDLAIMGDESALLVDYKTGKVKDDGFTQLKLAAAVFMIYHPNVQKVTVAYLWTEAKGKVTKEVYTRGQITQIWNELLPRINRFNEAHARDSFPANPSGLCRNHCIIEDCPHHGG